MKPQLIKCQHSGKKQMPRLKQLQRCLNYFYPKKSLTLQLIGFPSWNLTTGYASINSCGAHPPWATTGHLLKCQSRGWGISNFIAARGLGISLPRGDPRAFDTRVFELRVCRKGRGLRERLASPSRTRKTCGCF